MNQLSDAHTNNSLQPAVSETSRARVRCVLMYSGGLDSTIAGHLLLSQGIDVTALHFVLPFAAGLSLSHAHIRELAGALGVLLRIEEEGEEFLGMVKEPRFGYGKNANPCMDCRIHRLEKAARIMRETGAQFIATGEVVGQRPMSQRRDCMDAIEKRSGLKGLLLRPLSALLLPLTLPETNGWVDRQRLLGISGRGRREQFAYAKKFGLRYLSPGGGCLLTQKEIGNRFMDLREHEPDFTLADFKMLAYGRHFRMSGRVRMVVGRDRRENEILEKLFQPGDLRLHMADMEGPLGIVRGAPTAEMLHTCASILARYSRARSQESARVTVIAGGKKQLIEIRPAGDEECAKYRISEVE